MLPKFKVTMSVMALDKKARFDGFPFAEMEFMVRDMPLVSVVPNKEKPESVFEFIHLQVSRLALAVPSAEDMANDMWLVSSANDIVRFNDGIRETKKVIAEKFTTLIVNGVSNVYGTILHIEHKTHFFNINCKISVDHVEQPNA